MTINYNINVTQDSILVIPLFESLNYFVQDWTLPGIDLPAFKMGYENHTIPMPGETPTFESLPVTFLMDEDQQNRIMLMDWMISYRDKEGITSRFKDIKMIELNRNKVFNLEYTFFNAHPVNISSVSRNTNLNDVDSSVCTVMFDYTHYKVTTTMKEHSK